MLFLGVWQHSRGRRRRRRRINICKCAVGGQIFTFRRRRAAGTDVGK
jgi:hypothetical protein